MNRIVATQRALETRLRECVSMGATGVQIHRSLGHQLFPADFEDKSSVQCSIEQAAPEDSNF